MPQKQEGQDPQHLQQQAGAQETDRAGDRGGPGRMSAPVQAQEMELHVVEEGVQKGHA